MVEVSKYDINFNTLSRMKVIWAKSVDATQTLLIPSCGAEYPTLNEG